MKVPSHIFPTLSPYQLRKRSPLASIRQPPRTPKQLPRQLPRLALAKWQAGKVLPSTLILTGNATRFQAREYPFRIPRRSSLRARVARHHPGTRLSPPTPPLFLDLSGAALTYVTASLGLLMAAVESIQLSIACRLPHAPAPSPRHPSSYGPAHWPLSMSMLQHSLWLSLP